MEKKDLTTPLVFSNHESYHDVQKDSEVKEDLQDDGNILKQDDNVASDVVASRGRHQAKLPPGAIAKIRPSKPSQSPDGEKIWAQQTLNNDAVLDLEEGGLHEPLHNTQQKLLKQGGDSQPTKGRETSAPKVTCGPVTSEEKHQAKHPGAKPKKRPSELPESPEDKKSSVQQASTTVGTMSCNCDVVLEGNLRSQSSEQMPLNPNNSESLTQPSLPLYSNQEPILHDSPSRQPAEAKYLSPPSCRFGKARKASSKDDSSDSGQENNFVTGQDTMVTSQSGTTMQLPPRPSTPEENDDMIKNDGLMQKLKKENKTLRLNETHLVEVNRTLTQDLQKQSEEILRLKDQAETSRTENAQLLEQKGALEQENNELKERLTERLGEITSNMDTIRMAEVALRFKFNECEEQKETIRHLKMVIDQLVSRNASGIRTIVDNQTSGSSSDYLQLPGSAVDFSSQEAKAEGVTVNTNNQLEPPGNEDLPDESPS
ncbi:uncharacterized protein [Porites lutea]|uniref:uncharacterized protein n=1 Tax=Porites lutea TaxID=51062 RepID=UPI003CC60B3B